MEKKVPRPSILPSALTLLLLSTALFAQNGFHFDNLQGTTSAFLVPGGKYVHKVVLAFTTTSAAIPAFSIKADADALRAISPGSSFSYHARNVAMTGGSGSYTVSIETPTPDAYFSSDESWSLTVSGLSVTNTTSSFTVGSQDVSGVPLSPDPTYFRYCWTWPGGANVPALFKIPAGGVVDDALLYIRIVKQGSAPNPSFVIKPTGLNQTILVAADGNPHDTSAPLDNGVGEVYRLALLSAVSSGSIFTNLYRLELRNDTDSGFPPAAFASAEEWILLVQDSSLAAGDSLELFAASRNAGSTTYTGTEAVSTNIVTLNQPPRPQITNPGINPCSIVKGRSYVFTSAHGDLEAAALAYAWNIRSGTSNDNFSSSQNPTETPFTTINGHAYDTYADYALSLTVTETLATITTGPYVGPISQSGTTVLAAALSPEEKIGFPRYLSLPYYPNPPVIDGYISDSLGSNRVDAAWRAASRYTMLNGAPTAHVAFQGMKSSSGDALYMSFEVRNDGTLDAEDALVLAFRPEYSSTDTSITTTAFRNNDVVMIIYPFAGPGGAPTGAAPNRVEIWKYDGSSWQDVSSVYTSWSIVGRSFDFNSLKAWDMELKLPIGTAPMALNDQFYFYYDVLRVSTSGATQFFWPRDSRNLGVVLRPSSLFAGSWGKADKASGAALDGVWCDWNALSVTPPNPNYPADDFWITYNDSTPVENTFTTTVKNDRQETTEAGTTYIDSPGVIVLLRMANWGIAGANPGPDWEELDVLFPDATEGTNPSEAKLVPRATGPSSPGTATFVFKTRVGPTAALPPNISSEHHQCIYVELNADQDVYIKSKGVYRNMNFAHASELRREATISVRGFGPAPKGRTGFRYLLVTSQKAITIKDDSHGPDRGPGPVGMSAAPADRTSIDPSYLTWEVNGYLCTGSYIVIRGKPFEILNATGSFGYIVEHDAEVASWDPQIEGARLEGSGSYSLDIPAESAVTIHTVITPREFTPLALSAHAGAAFPLANFGSSYSVGFCGILDAQWAFSDALSLVFMAGYNYLPGASPVVLPTSIINLALDFRYTRPINPALFAYAQAGPNLYIQDFSTTALGVNVGLGFGYVLSPRFRVEAGADVHSTTTLQNWLLQTHLGIVMRL